MNHVTLNLLARWWLNPNVRFLFVALASVASIFWMTHWPPGGSMEVGASRWALVWGIAYAFFPGLLTIFFGAWGIKLLFQVTIHSPQTTLKHVRTPADEATPVSPDPSSKQARRLTAGYLIGIALLLVVAWALSQFTNLGAASFPTSISGSILLGELCQLLSLYTQSRREYLLDLQHPLYQAKSSS
jgi:hypothetical protein